jgi:hypothetical protein|tara:strand:- start:372 stop:482 length:111 start_codon:yes stop_codon:yes gene_type:complete
MNQDLEKVLNSIVNLLRTIEGKLSQIESKIESKKSK